MQSSKTSKKTVKTTPAQASSAPQETASAARAPRSSQSKAVQTKAVQTKAVQTKAVQNIDAASKHHHKLATVEEPAVVTESTVETPVNSSISSADPVSLSDVSGEVTHDDIARLAHSFWAGRGFQHGDPEEDWHRAEEQLKVRAASV